MFDKSSNRKWRWIASGLFAIQSLVVLTLIIQSKPWLTGDSARYMALADSLKSSQDFGLRVDSIYEPEGMRMPGYPIFIAFCSFLPLPALLGVVIIQGCLFFISVWLFWRIAERVWGCYEGVGFLALSTVYPFIAYSVGQISPEIPTVFLVAAAFYMLLNPTTPRVAAVGLMIGIATYFRPNLFLLSFVIAISCVMADRRMYRKSLILIITALLAALPWTLRNYSTFGVVTPVSVIRGTGNSLFLATWQSKVSTRSLIEYGMRGGVTPEFERSGMLAQIHSVNRQIGVSQDTVFVSLEAYKGNETKARADRLFTEAAWRNMKFWPGTYLFSSMKNMARMWFSANLPERLPGLVRGMLVGLGIAALVLGITGLTIELRRGARAHKVMVYSALGTFLYFTLTLCWLHTEARYTLSARMIMLVFASHAIVRGVRRVIGLNE
jgi:hypothetical protein